MRVHGYSTEFAIPITNKEKTDENQHYYENNHRPNAQQYASYELRALTGYTTGTMDITDMEMTIHPETP